LAGTFVPRFIRVLRGNHKDIMASTTLYDCSLSQPLEDSPKHLAARKVRRSWRSAIYGASASISQTRRVFRPDLLLSHRVGFRLTTGPKNRTPPKPLCTRSALANMSSS